MPSIRIRMPLLCQAARNAYAILLLMICCIQLNAADSPQTAIFVMNTDGTELKKWAQATDRLLHGNPAFSKDGKTVIFHAYTKEPKTVDCHIFLSKDDGSEIKDLGAGREPCWTPDNKQIVFTVPENHADKLQAGTWVMNADGKGRQFVGPGYSPKIAVDGSKALYVSSHEGNQSIYTFDMIEATPKKILQENFQKKPGTACWSPDGKRIAFVDERNGKSELLLIDSTGTEKKQTVRFRGLIGGPVTWAPNRLIAFWIQEKESTDAQRLHTVDPDTEDAPVLMPQQDLGMLNYDPSWSNDGQRIAFVSDRTLKVEKPAAKEEETKDESKPDIKAADENGAKKNAAEEKPKDQK